MTNHRTIQWMGIITAAIALAVGYWYFSARAGVKQGAPLGGPAPSNLVGYWSFDGDDISGTTAYDVSGAGHHGTLTNGPTIINGKLGQALSFDGTDDYVSGSVPLTTTPFTVCQWIYPTDVSTDFRMPWSLMHNNNPSNGWYFGLGSGGSFNFSAVDNDSYTGTPSKILVANNWYHVCGVAASAASRSLYVDGIFIGIDTTSVAPSLGPVTHLIGAWRAGDLFRFKGSIDETRIYNTALTASQIYDLYKLGGETVGASTPTRDSLNEGLAGYWKLDDTSGTTAVDSSTNANNGTLTNGPTWGTGQIGGDIVLDGSNDYIAVTDSDSLDFNDGEDFSLTGWFYRNSGGSSDVIIDKQSGSYYGYKLSIDSANGETMTFLVRDTQGDQYSIATTATFTTPGWYHFVAVFRKSSATDTKIYINGVVSATTPTGTISSINDLRNAGGLEIGANFDATQNFIGKLDEIRIYRRALSSDEITKLYKTTTPSNPDTRLKGYWSFDGDAISGTTARDLSGAGNNGTLTNGPVGTFGIHGQAMSFDGTNDYITFGDQTALEINGSSLSLGGWFKISSYPSGNREFLVTKGGSSGSGPSYEYELEINGFNSNKLRFAVYDSSGVAAYIYVDSVSIPPLNTWFHVTAIWDKDAPAAKLYYNGVLEGTSTSTVGSIHTLRLSNFVIGRRDDNAETSLTGSADEVRVYNAALTASEIYNLYQEGNVKVNKSQSNNGDSLNDGLAGYWKLDDASGTTATDSSGNGSSGTLTNGPTWGTGQIGGATTFDGNNDYITVPDSTTLRPGNGSFTVSVWANPPNATQLAFLVSKTAGNPGYSMRICGADPSCGGYSGKRFVFTYAESMVAPIYRGAYSTSDIADGSWHLFTAVADKTANLIRLYVDGREIAANQGTGGSWPNITNTDALSLGSFTGSNYYHTGSLDEVRIYNRALSAEEVTKLYKTTSPTNPETGLVGYWSFNGKDVVGTTAYDRSGRGNNGTLTNGPTTTFGKIGQALTFDGTDDRVNITSPSGLASGSGATWSLAAWVKVSALNSAYHFILTYGDGSVGATPSIMVSSGNKWRVSVKGTDLDATSPLPQAGEWTYIVGTCDGTNLRLYVNGVLSAGPSAVTNAPNTASARIGTSVDNLFFSGSIDEARIYNRALSATEIANLYNWGR